MDYLQEIPFDAFLWLLNVFTALWNSGMIALSIIVIIVIVGCDCCSTAESPKLAFDRKKKDPPKNKKTSAKDAAKEMHERIMSLLTEAHNSPASAVSASTPGVYCVDPTFDNVSKFFGTTATTTAELIAYLVKEEKKMKTRSDVFETFIYNLPPPGVMSYAQGTSRLFIEFGCNGNMAVVPHMANGRFLTFIVVEDKPQPGERLTQLF